MKKETRNILIAAAAIVVIIGGAIGLLYAYSGMGSSPLTVIESGSMQHSTDTSYVGTIDTGDMVVMVSPNKTSVTTYVEGYQSGYSKFNNYGDVIIYYRANGASGNPIIHRAIIWLNYIDSGTYAGQWSAPSLKDYPSDLWSVSSGTYEHMSGTFNMKFSDYKGHYYTCSINLDNLQKHSGYLTKGDNPYTNSYFDQSCIPGAIDCPIEKKSLKAVAGIEIPWFGCIKLLMKNKNVDMIPHNSIPSLAMVFVDLIMFFITLSVVMDIIALSNVPIEEPQSEKKIQNKKKVQNKNNVQNKKKVQNGKKR